MEYKQIVFTAPGVAELLNVNDAPLGADQVKVQTVITTISNGTERANLIGDVNVNSTKPADAVAKFPRTVGYSSSGIVLEVGENVKDLAVGDRVVMSWSKHKSVNILPQKNVAKIESEKISFEEASLFHIATFPLAALRKTRLEIGEPAIIMGLGILGLTAVQLARVAGAVPVIAVDPVADRREKALKYGADYALDPTAPDFAETVKKLTGGGAKVGIEVTGVGAGLNGILDCMRPAGRVALLGCTRDKEFTVDYYRKVHGPGITLIGAHTQARPKDDSAPGWFTERDDILTLIKLTALGRLNLAQMIEETYSPAECGEVFGRLANDRAFPTVVQFDWTRL
jgi:threonine dehydrogenase-like Zn-dependent dehydrogenase